MKVLILTSMNPVAISDASFIYKQFSSKETFVFSPQLMAILAEQSIKDKEILYVPYMLSILKCLKPKMWWEEKDKYKHTIFFGNKFKEKSDNFDVLIYLDAPYLSYDKTADENFDGYIKEIKERIPNIPKFYTPKDCTHKLPTVEKIILLLETLGIHKTKEQEEEGEEGEEGE